MQNNHSYTLYRNWDCICHFNLLSYPNVIKYIHVVYIFIVVVVRCVISSIISLVDPLKDALMNDDIMSSTLSQELCSAYYPMIPINYHPQY